MWTVVNPSWVGGFNTCLIVSVFGWMLNEIYKAPLDEGTDPFVIIFLMGLDRERINFVLRSTGCAF